MNNNTPELVRKVTEAQAAARVPRSISTVTPSDDIPGTKTLQSVAAIDVIKSRLIAARIKKAEANAHTAASAAGADSENARVIPGTKTVQSPAPRPEDDDEPDEVEAALRRAQEELAVANGTGHPGKIAKAVRDLDAASIAVIKSRLAAREGQRR